MFPIKRNIHDKINGIQLISGCICAASVGGASLKQEKPRTLIWSPWKLPCAAAATKHKDARKTPAETFCLFALANSTESERIVIEKVIKRGGARSPLQAPRASICFPRRALANLRSPECETQIIRLHAGDSYCCLRLSNKRSGVIPCSKSSFGGGANRITGPSDHCTHRSETLSAF